jgi:hypothetical protein
MIVMLMLINNITIIVFDMDYRNYNDNDLKRATSA